MCRRYYPNYISYAKYLYTNSHQCVFAVKYRDAVINCSWKERLYKYIIAIVNNN